MPVKVIPTALAYKGFSTTLKELGFLEVGSKEEERFLKKNHIDLNVFPRPQDVYDDIWIFYTLNGYRVKLRTTITAEPFAVSNSDAAWLIIENERGKAVMYSQPIHRTKNFFVTLLAYAEIFQYIVRERPLCRCNADMNIEKFGLRKYRYKCSMASIALDHDDPIEVYQFIYNKLTKRLQYFLNIKFSKENYNRRIAEKDDKTFGSRALTRKKWKTL